jgi:hypothetical protein
LSRLHFADIFDAASTGRRQRTSQGSLQLVGIFYRSSEPPIGQAYLFNRNALATNAALATDTARAWSDEKGNLLHNML